LAVSNALADLYKSVTPNISVIHNGADPNRWKIPLSENSNDKKFTVGFLGAFEYFIDFQLLVDVIDRMPDVQFLLVGHGRLFSWVKEQIRMRGNKNVILTGAVPYLEVGKYVSQMDVCLNTFKKIPISHRACPIKLFEYLVLKKPVISTRLEEVEKIDRQCVFFADTVDETVAIIEKIRLDPSISDEYVKRGYDMVINRYSWDPIVTRFEQLLISELEKKGKKK